MRDDKRIVKRDQDTSLQVWAPMDFDALDEFDERVRASRASEFVKLKPGKNQLRFLPSTAEAKTPFVMVMEHYLREGEVPNYKGVFKFVCPRLATKGRLRCPACEHADALRKNGNPLDRDAAFEWGAKLRIYANVVDRRCEEEGPKVFAFGTSIWEALRPIAKDKHDGGDFTDPREGGFDIVVERSGSGKNDTEYSVRPSRNNTPLHADPEIVREWLKRRFKLEQYATLPDHEQLMEVLRGGVPADTRAAPKSRARGPNGEAERPSRRTVQDDIERVIDVDYRDEGEEEPPL